MFSPTGEFRSFARLAALLVPSQSRSRPARSPQESPRPCRAPLLPLPRAAPLSRCAPEKRTRNSHPSAPPLSARKPPAADLALSLLARADLPETPLSRHVRKNFAVQFVERHPHLHRRLLTVRRRNHRPHLRRVRRIRIRLPRRHALLPWLHPRDVRLVHIHFNLVRRHVHDRRNPCSREPATRRYRRHHLSYLRVLRNHLPRERRAYRAVVHRLLRFPDPRFRGLHLLLRQRDFRPQAVRGHNGVVQSLLRLHSRLLQFRRSPQLNLRVLQLHLEVRYRRLRRVTVRFRRIQRPPRVGIIQRRQQLPFLHFRPLVKVDARHPPRDFRRDRRPPSRRHVPARIQRRPWSL